MMSDPETHPPVRTLVVDDQCIVREGVTALLERDARIKVIGTATSGVEAIEVARKLDPDVVVMDVMLPELSGIDAAERIVMHRSKTRVVILTVCCTTESIIRALRAGALGYVSKHSAPSELIDAVVGVVRGKRQLSARVLEHLQGLEVDDATQSPLERLSPRERQVLHLVVAGVGTAEIGLRLSLSPKTVETYRSRVMEKLGIRNQAALFRFALEHSLMTK